MLYEFALEPSLINNLDRLDKFITPFVIQEGRLIAEFPKINKWKRKVRQACKSCKEIEKKRIESRLEEIDEHFFHSGRNPNNIRPCNLEKEWLEEAIAAHKQNKFHAIIASENPESHPRVLPEEEWKPNHHLLNVNTGGKFPRKPQSYITVSRPLVLMSREILFVDTYIDFGNRWYRDSMAKFMALIFSAELPPDRVEIHTKAKTQRDSEGHAVKDANGDIKFEDRYSWEKSCVFQFCPHIPRGNKVKIVRWKDGPEGDGPHARYLLTEKWGIGFDWGLDMGREGQTTDISLMRSHLYNERWRDYNVNKSAYEVLDERTITGTGE